MPHLDDEHDPFWPAPRDAATAPPPPPPPALERHRVGPAAIANPELVAAEGPAGQIAAACAFQSATADFMQTAAQHRKALDLPPHHAAIELFALGSVGATVRRAAAAVHLWDLSELLEEALVALELPASLQPVEFIVKLPARLSLQGFEDTVGEAVHRRFERHDPQHIPPPRLGQLLVPRFNAPRQFPDRAAFPSQRATSSWILPFVRHRLVLRPHPGIPLGVSLNTEYLIPPSGLLAHPVQSPDDFVRLFAAPAHVDLAYQLVRMWSADDRRSPLYRSREPAVVAVSALNCMVMHETQVFLLTVHAAIGADTLRSEHLSCTLAGFVAFTEELFAAPSPSFAGALVGHHALFRDWLLYRFGSETSRRACARECVGVLARYWPSIRSAASAEARASRERQVEDLLAQAFLHIYSLAFPPEHFV
ncbi:hypothetical protein JCM9279_007345 [Rhodotorula babjevae]